LKITGDTIEGTYRKQGTYTIILLGEDPEGKSMRMPISIAVGSASAALKIDATPDNGVAPLNVLFDASRSFIPPGEELAGYQWSFGDEGQSGRQAEPGPARVVHEYKGPGEYVVNLRAVMESGKQYSVDRTIVVRRPGLSACMTASRLTVEAGGAVEFDSSCSAGVPTSILWDVRSASQQEVVLAQSPNPKYVHVFERPGEHIVTLTLKDSFGNQDKKTLSITVTSSGEQPAASPTPPPTSDPSPAPVEAFQ
jgi:PKD repeat protein